MALLDREGERAALDAFVGAAARGAGGLVVLEGPAGVGKSALLCELAGLLDDAGLANLPTRVTRIGRGVPLGLVRRLLESALAEAPSLLRGSWARRARPVFEGEFDGDRVEAPLLEGLVALVANLVDRNGPTVVVVDDAHWADSASLVFLGELAARREEIGVGLALAIRTGEPAADERALERVRACEGVRLLAPAPLSATAVESLARARLPDVDAAFCDRLFQASGGNPQLVVELLDAAERSGSTELEVPDSLARAVSRQLEGLGADTRALAEAIAVLGEAPLRLAVELAGMSRRTAEVAADELCARGLIAADERARFLQPIVGRALSAGLPPFELGARHRRAAELRADAGEQADAVARHLLVSGPAADPWASVVLRRAGQLALERGEPAAAAQLFERGLSEPAVDSERDGLLVELAQARAAAGLPSAVEAFELALDSVADASRRADAWHGFSRMLYVRGEHAGAAAAAAHGQAELAADDPRRERLLADELAAAIRAPELAADAAARTEALIAADTPTDPALLAHLIVYQGWRGLAVERIPQMVDVVVANDPLIDRESGGFALSCVCGALNMIDRTPRAGELLDAGLERVAELGDKLAEVSLRCCRAWSLIYRGELEAARRDLDAVQSMSELGLEAIQGLCGPPLVALRLELGDLDGAREALERTPRGIHNPGLDWSSGTVALAAGDAAAALDSFEAAGAELEGALGAINPGVLPWRSSAALAAARLGEESRARDLVMAEVEQARRVGVARALGIALRTAGIVTSESGLFEESVAVLEHSPARLELARSLLFLGIDRRRARRAREARAPLGRAFDLARECGASALSEHALAELQAAGARPRRRPRSGVGALTASERRIAELAAAGHTTRHIAAELFLSPKTVEGHLTSAFRKLRVSSRSELAPLFAPEHDATPG